MARMRSGPGHRAAGPAGARPAGEGEQRHRGRRPPPEGAAARLQGWRSTRVLGARGLQVSLGGERYVG